MTFRFMARGGLALALTSLSFMTLACGNANVPKPTIKGSRTDAGADAKVGLATKPKPKFDAQAQMLADQLELDLVSQGVSAADARAIALGALDGSRSEVSAGEGQAIALIDLSGFLPGFLKGALGVAKTVFAGSPIGIAGSIVESIVKGFSKTPDAPKEVLSSLPAIALETLLKGGTQGNGNSGSAPKVNTIQDMLAALLASGRGIAAVPQAGSDTALAGADLSKQMMEQLVAMLMKQPGANAGVLGQLLPALQDNLQQRLMVQGGAKMPDVLGAVADGQFAALVGLKGLPADRDALINLLLQKGADSLLTKVGVGDDALRSKLVAALAQGAAKNAKQDTLQALVQTLTKSVMNLDERAAPLKKQALEAALMGLSKGVLATNAVTKDELADVFSSVSNQLRSGMSTGPQSSDELLEELLAVIARRSKAG